MSILDKFDAPAPEKKSTQKKKSSAKTRKAPSKASSGSLGLLDTMVSQMRRGQNAILVDGRAKNIEEPKFYFDLGVPTLHQASSCPRGIPSSRMMLVWGESGTGKSYLHCKTTAVALNQAFNDESEETFVLIANSEGAPCYNMIEHAGLLNYKDFLPDSTNRVWRNHLIMDVPRHIEGTAMWFFKMTDKIRKVAPKSRVLWVWDSIASSKSKQEVERTDLTKNEKVANHASAMKSVIGPIKDRVIDDNILLLEVNQQRENIDTSGGASYGPVSEEQKRKMPGGKRVWFENDFVLYLKRGSKISEVPKWREGSVRGRKRAGRKSVVVGNDVVARWEKVRGGPSYTEIEYRFFYKDGIDDVESCIFFLADRGIIKDVGGEFRLLPIDPKTGAKFKPVKEKSYNALVAAVKARPRIVEVIGGMVIDHVDEELSHEDLLDAGDDIEGDDE